MRKKQTPSENSEGVVAERKGFEPLRALGALHDFQSCALDQLSHLSIFDDIALYNFYITFFAPGGAARFLAAPLLTTALI